MVEHVECNTSVDIFHFIGSGSTHYSATYCMLPRMTSCDDNTINYESSKGITLASLLDGWIEEVYEELDDLFHKTQDKQIADAVLTIFKTRHDLDLFKKKLS